MSTNIKIKIKIFAFLLIIFGGLSLFAFLNIYNYHEQERLKKVNLPTTDLTKININNQKIGEYFQYGEEGCCNNLV